MVVGDSPEFRACKLLTACLQDCSTELLHLVDYEGILGGDVRN